LAAIIGIIHFVRGDPSPSLRVTSRKCHSDIAHWVVSEKADHVILSAAKNLDCYADLCNQALNCLAGLLYVQLYDVAVL